MIGEFRTAKSGLFMTKRLGPLLLAIASVAMTFSVHAVTNTPPDFDLAVYAGTGAQEGNGIAVDSSGNMYVTGQYQGGGNFGGTTLTNFGSQDYFLASFTTNGTLRWALGAGTSSSDFGSTVKLASNGDVVVSISAFGPLNLHGTTVTGFGNRDAFLARYTSTGTLIWAKAVGSSDGDQADDVAIDSDGNIILVGRIAGLATAGTNTFGAAFASKHFMVKFNGNGDVLWAKTFSDGEGLGAGVAVDGANNILVTGAASVSGQNAVTVAKFNSNGTLQWQTNHLTFFGSGASVAVDGANNVYVTGTFSATNLTIGSSVLDNPAQVFRGFLAKYDSNGSPQWATRVGGRGYRVSVLNNGTVYTAGFFQTTSTNFDPVSVAIEPSTTRNAFITKHDSSGNLSWVRQVAAVGNEILRGITTDSTGIVHVIGEGTTEAMDIDVTPKTGSVVIGRLSTNSLARFTLTTSVSPQFGGVIGISPEHSDNIYLSKSVVQLTAYPGGGKAFAGWSNDASGMSNPLNLVMDGNKNVTAVFTNIPVESQFVLTTNVTPSGSGSIELSPDNADGKYDSNTVVQLTAVPGSGKKFSGWSGAVTGTNNPINVTMTAAKSVTATFTDIPVGPTVTLTTNVSPAGSGSITVDPPGTSFSSNAVVTLTAVPASGKIFVRWTGASTATTNPISLTLSGNKSITAVFTNAPKYYVLSTNVTPGSNAGTITASIAPTTNGYAAGKIVTLTATPKAGFKFVKWSGASAALTAKISLTMNTNKSVMAVFTNIPRFLLNVTLSPTNAGTVMKSPSTVSSNDYYSGTVVSLTPVANTGYKFVKWTGALTGAIVPGKVTMNANKSVTAVFTTVPTFVLTPSVNPPGAGDIIADPATLNNTYSSNAFVGLTAVATTTNQFVAWTGSFSSFSNQVSIKMNSNKTATAIFNAPGKLYWQSTNSFISLWLMQNSNYVASALMNNGKSIAKSWRLAGTIDFDNNGSKDLLFQNNNGAVMLWMMTNNFIIRTQVLKTAPLGIKLIGAGNFTTNTSPDLLWQNNASGALTVWTFKGVTYSGSQNVTSAITPGTTWKAIAVADFNNDTQADILFQNTDGRVMIWFMNGVTMTSGVILNGGVAPLTGWKASAVSDLDNNGTPDILFQVGGQSAIWALNGTNILSESFIANGGNMPASWTLRAGK